MPVIGHTHNGRPPPTRTQDNQPDWDKIAEKFDIGPPQLAPVGEALLTHLAAQPGDRILDLASRARGSRR